MAIKGISPEDVRRKESLDILNSFSDEELVVFYFTNDPQLRVSSFDSIESLKGTLLGTLNSYSFSDRIKNFNTSPIKEMITKNKFKCFKSDYRKLMFYINFFMFKLNYNKYIVNELFNPNTNPYLLLIYITYEQENNYTYVEPLSNEAEQEYAKFYSTDVNKYIDNNDFIDWAINYIRSKSFDYRYFINDFNGESKKLFILSFLDYNCFANELEYYKFTKRMKKAWQQKQFKDGGKEKTNYHLPLSKKTKSELTQLSEIRNCSEAKVLEDLIKNECVNNSV